MHFWCAWGGVISTSWKKLVPENMGRALKISAIFPMHILCFIDLFLFKSWSIFAYGSFQARGWIGAAAALHSHSHSHAGSEPCLRSYTTAHGNARSLIHFLMYSSWVPAESQQELPEVGKFLYHFLDLFPHFIKYIQALNANSRNCPLYSDSVDIFVAAHCDLYSSNICVFVYLSPF